MSYRDSLYGYRIPATPITSMGGVNHVVHIQETHVSTYRKL